YSMLQQKMETSIAALRGRVRALLSARGPEMAQLAAVDGAMEQAMVEHELRLLAGIPNLLEQRFRQLAQEGLMKEPARASALTAGSAVPMAASTSTAMAPEGKPSPKPHLSATTSASALVPSMPAVGAAGKTSTKPGEKSEPQGSLAPKTAARGSESESESEPEQGRKGESHRVSSLQAQL